jgi:hypothetical protein
MLNHYNNVAAIYSIHPMNSYSSILIISSYLEHSLIYLTILTLLFYINCLNYRYCQFHSLYFIYYSLLNHFTTIKIIYLLIDTLSLSTHISINILMSVVVTYYYLPTKLTAPHYLHIFYPIYYMMNIHARPIIIYIQ